MIPKQTEREAGSPVAVLVLSISGLSSSLDTSTMELLVSALRFYKDALVLQIHILAFPTPLFLCPAAFNVPHICANPNRSPPMR